MTSIAIGFVVFATRLIAEGAPLGWDEAVYALKARSIGLGTPTIGWSTYRAPGLPALLSPIVTSGESSLRLMVSAFGLIGVANTWWLARRLLGPATAAIAATGLALTPVWLTASTQIWPDVPGAVLGLAALTSVILATETDQLKWWGLLAVPLTFLATLFRFGAPIPIAIGLIIIGLARSRVFLRNPGRSAILVGGLLTAVALVLLVPAITAASATPLGSILRSRDANDFPITQGFIDYGARYQEVFGATGILIVVTGVGLALTRAKHLRGYASMMAGAGLLTIVAIAAVLHGELRYLAPALPLLWIGAADGLASVTSGLSRSPNTFLGGLAVLVMMSGALTYADDMNDWLYRWQGLRTVSNEIGANYGPACEIFTARAPVAAWYSNCDVASYDPSNLAALSELNDDALPSFLLLLDTGGQIPEPDQFEDIGIDPADPTLESQPPPVKYFVPTFAFEIADEP